MGKRWLCERSSDTQSLCERLDTGKEKVAANERVRGGGGVEQVKVKALIGHTHHFPPTSSPGQHSWRLPCAGSLELLRSQIGGSIEFEPARGNSGAHVATRFVPLVVIGDLLCKVTMKVLNCGACFLAPWASCADGRAGGRRPCRALLCSGHNGPLDACLLEFHVGPFGCAALEQRRRRRRRQWRPLA